MILADELDFGTTEKVLPLGIQLWNIKAPSFNIKMLWLMLIFVDKQRNRWTGQALYAHKLSIQGHKYCQKKKKKKYWLHVFAPFPSFLLCRTESTPPKNKNLDL